MNARGYRPTIGLEIHAELDTRAKMFCACPRVALSAPANHAVCPVCMGLPGTLPTINAEAMRLAVRAALALGAEVAETGWFARKNYFYPDLVKGYQISQSATPIGQGGAIECPDGTRVFLRRIHLEEDTARLLESRETGRMGVDLNRSGAPLLEVVTEPALHSAASAEAAARALRALLVHLGVSRGRIERGELRVEANVSVAPAGADKLGARVEIKNQAGFAHMRAAVEYEIGRQSAVLAGGGIVRQETRGWNPVRGETFLQRAKEDAHDYRYFPEPDLPAFRLPSAWLAEERIRVSGPDGTPRAFAARLAESGVRAEIREAILAHDASAFLRSTEAALIRLNAAENKKDDTPLAAAASGFSRFVLPLLNAMRREMSSLLLTPEALATVLSWSASGRLNPDGVRLTLAKLAEESGDPEEVARSVDAFIVDGDNTAVEEAVSAILAERAGWVTEWRAGKTPLRNAILGEVMKRLGRGHDPRQVIAVLDRALVDPCRIPPGSEETA